MFMNNYLYFDRCFSILDRYCVNIADTTFREALTEGTPDAVRRWCRDHPRRMHKSFDWLTDHRDNLRVKEIIGREIERFRAKRAYLLAIWIAVGSMLVSSLVTWLCSDSYRFSPTTTPPQPPPPAQGLPPQ